MLLLIPRQMRLVSFKILVQVVQITEPQFRKRSGNAGVPKDRIPL